MKRLILTVLLIFLALPASADRPWWVEGSFAPVDLSLLADAPKPAIARVERLPSVLTLIQTAADRYDLDPDLLRALVAQESAYNPAAVSEDGAIGLGQLMPVVASWCGVNNRFHRVENINCAARHLRVLLTKYDDDERLALAAYNAGEPAVDKCHCVPDYPETQHYVARIMLLRETQKGDGDG